MAVVTYGISRIGTGLLRLPVIEIGSTMRLSGLRRALICSVFLANLAEYSFKGLGVTYQRNGTTPGANTSHACLAISWKNVSRGTIAWQAGYHGGCM